MIVDHACSAYSNISVPLYDTLGSSATTDNHLVCLATLEYDLCTSTNISPAAGPDAVKFIVNHATVQAIFCVPQTLNIVSLLPSSQVVVDGNKH